MLKHKTIVADPPWSFKDALPGETRGAVKNYECMTIDQICKLDMPPIADDAVLFLWKVAALPAEAYRVIKAWGFVPKAELVWIKQAGPCWKCNGNGWGSPLATKVWCEECSGRGAKLAFGMGHHTRGAHETCVIATKGHPSRSSASVRSVFTAPLVRDDHGRIRHSGKPEKFYKLVEELYPGPYLELFGRRERDQWTVLGDELGTKLMQRSENVAV